MTETEDTTEFIDTLLKEISELTEKNLKLQKELTETTRQRDKFKFQLECVLENGIDINEYVD